MIRPTEMTRVSILGPKSRMRTVIQRLHDLNVLHIDDYDEELEGAEIGDPIGDAGELSDRLVRLRSLKSRLPDAEDGEAEGQADIDAVAEELDGIEEELEEVREMRAEKAELLDLFETVERLDLDLDAFRDYRSVDVHLGEASSPTALEALPDGRAEVHREGSTVALFVDADLDIDDELREAGFEAMDHTPLLARDGSVTEARQEVEEAVENLDGREAEIEAERDELGARWHGTLAEEEDELAEELERAEAPLRFATTDSGFLARGWIPTERLDEVVEELENATQGSIHVETEETEEAPVAHDNPQGVNSLESLISLYGTPKYSEVDPTFLLLTFPLLFGFMLADIGYGLTTFAVFYLFSRKFPDARGLWHSLMYASVATIAFGLLTGEMFGFLVFGEHGLIHSVPILFHREHMTSQILAMSIGIGVVHVNLGYLVGAYNEYMEHGVMEAVFAKLSWIIIEIGAVVAAFSGTLGLGSAGTYGGAAVAVAGVVMLYKGEKVEGVVEIPSLLSNILSYLRVFGVTMAVLVLAKVVNGLATPLFQSGSIVYMLLGVLVLVVGHTMNTFLKMMECGLQGIRLHYVEFFTKFFEGGGTYYKPFGTKEYGTR